MLNLIRDLPHGFVLGILKHSNAQQLYNVSMVIQYKNKASNVNFIFH